jgi:hypothetical protein
VNGAAAPDTALIVSSVMPVLVKLAVSVRFPPTGVSSNVRVSGDAASPGLY